MNDEINKWCDEIIEAGEKATPRPWHFHEGDLVNFEHKDAGSDWEEAYGPNGDEVGPDTKYMLAACLHADKLAAALKRAVEALEHAQITNCQWCSTRTSVDVALSGISTICAAATKTAR